MEHTDLLHGVAELLREASKRRRLGQQQLDRARQLAAAGSVAEAVAAYQATLRVLPHDAVAWHELALLQLKSGNAAEAKVSLIKSIKADGSRTQAHYDFGRLLAALPEPGEAPSEYLSLLGFAGAPARSLTSAEADCRRTLPQAPICDDYLRLAYLQIANGHQEDAFATLQNALAYGYQQPAVFHGLAGLSDLSGHSQAAHVYRGHANYFDSQNVLAIASYEEALAIGPAAPIVYARLAWSLAELKNLKRAIAICENGIGLHPDEPSLYCRLAEFLQADGQTEGARRIAASAAEQFPENFELKRLAALTLPVVYKTVEEISQYRQHFSQGLETLKQQLPSVPAAKALPGAWQNFYLAYQGRNDKALQLEFGRLLHAIMCGTHPQWSRPVHVPAPGADERIRVGYASAHFHNHTVAKLFLGWLQAHDRTHVEVFAYHLGARIDAMTHQYQRAADRFRHLPLPVENIAREVLKDRLHILVYLDIGMESITSELASLYLAPVQCVAWGHPVTTGFPTIDYFISSELMEPGDAEQHYSETLVRLPGIGINAARPHVEPGHKKADFGLRAEDCVYLSPQSAFKYLPQHDELFPRIASRVPNSKFVFLRAGSENVTDIVKTRLLRAFASRGLDGNRFLVFLPAQEHRAYLGLNSVADVFLDQPGWSGGMTALDALGCDLPVVTWPGEFMRGRHSSAFLRAMGLTETIASDLDDFVEIAARLGTDSVWRLGLKRQIAARHHRLFGDTTCVIALEQFYADVVSRFETR